MRPLLRLLISMLPISVMANPPPHSWQSLPPIPDPIGFAAPFAGTHNKVLIVAGGANFPEKSPWQGGTKIWHDRAFILEKPDAQWRTDFHLPRPLAYGVSISTPRGIVCIGGSDDQQHFRDVFLLQWLDGKLLTQPLPSLPQTCANACGAAIGNTLFVAGGQTTPASTSALHTFWSLDLTSPNPTWQTLEPWPGPARILATAAAHEGFFYLFSGADLTPGPDGKAQRTWLNDAYRYHPDQGWKKLSALPRPAVAAPSPAPLLNPTSIAVLGGDDGAQLHVAPTAHQGFPKTPLVYDIPTNLWREAPALPFSLVTTTVVTWQNLFVIPGGEAKPGIRSTEVWSLPLSQP
ncbi:galactose oxidase [Phragmitibacter flavus]|uniref:Galactose oxidase n=1 Tax=Phragmitibacter flavus TaxID=2576071 RepID=A0A5R8K931_9BACT|nr:galactose oxidase [Phragmitibacter flavus]TLD68832.1 galactose oxidase [Phragmitibacter flavus]